MNKETKIIIIGAGPTASGLATAANNLKVYLKTLENSQPKSKYINKPQHNFKNRGIPQKRNNQKYYKKR